VGGISYFFDDVPTKSPIAKKIKKNKNHQNICALVCTTTN